MRFTLAALVARLGGELVGDGTVEIDRIAPLHRAGIGALGFVADPKYLPQLATTQASALILPAQAADASSLPRILTDSPYLYFARVSQLLNPPPRPPVGVAASARIDPSAVIAADACIGEGVVIGARACIGAGSVVSAGCVIGDDTVIGAGCQLYANVTVYHACVLGDRAIVHSGVVIGADGFGFAPDGERWEKIPQTGRVVIGDDVEIGANTTIDRGALDDTVIENGVKLDNQIQIAHNVRIGAHTAIAACTGIAGSARIGARCTIGGAAMIFGHIEIADDVRISTNTLITKSLPRAGTYTSALPFSEHAVWQKNAVQMRNLDKLAARIKALEQKLAELENPQ